MWFRAYRVWMLMALCSGIRTLVGVLGFRVSRFRFPVEGLGCVFPYAFLLVQYPGELKVNLWETSKGL